MRARRATTVSAGGVGRRRARRRRVAGRPHGLAGHLYWWALAPFHRLIFGRMPGNVIAAAR
ncbi:DUF2867 domain-containing protein [Nonomuraea sp. MG754425]|uniref:DUF2867 domain-containing protein n=1 Tax=Nonomuraea sp. MG754425 TaxID=2570319 RepID=UPI0023516902|nr:DUF2867 domain-containing protein [Nonomuraea sp. MG754425]